MSKRGGFPGMGGGMGRNEHRETYERSKADARGYGKKSSRVGFNRIWSDSSEVEQ